MNYCAFLRGVNVNGTRMKMAEVCQVFERSGLQNVSYVLATGNILFSSESNPPDLKKILEEKLSKHFNYEAFLFLKSENQLTEIVNKNPFKSDENLHHYVFISDESMGIILTENFSKCLKSFNEKGFLIDGVFYWQVEKGNTLDSEFGKILGKKAFKEMLTSRNINTLEKIILKFKPI
ncbi:DUF1697 domain-containing protein [Kaistella polysaccharea]|uniref:DUF1697 domain-containing protein n=1 Tax=Kaistella polysaccharea TaxID=2878534 RepID=UPI001CF498E9|nr:DUF1697 domain-containing protein [Kaistella polysaccharea]